MNAAQTHLPKACRDERWPIASWLLLALLLQCVSMLGVGGARAQISASDKAAAEALFDEGLRLLRQGRNAEACVKLEQSQTIEHGIGTMLYLADCYERIGRVASAWALFREAASLADQAGQSERAGVANERAEALESRIPRLTIEVPADTLVEGLEVRRGGKTVPPALWGVAVPVDPGEQVIEAFAPGHQLHRERLPVQEGQTTAKATIPQLERIPGGVAVASPPPVVESAKGAAATPETGAAQGRKQRMRTSGWVIGGVGVAGLVGAGVMGGLAIQKDKRADARCSGSICETQGGLNAARDAKRFADVSTGLWVAGGVLAATGLTLILLSRDAETRTNVALDASPGFAGVRVSGGF